MFSRDPVPVLRRPDQITDRSLRVVFGGVSRDEVRAVLAETAEGYQAVFDQVGQQFHIICMGKAGPGINVQTGEGKVVGQAELQNGQIALLPSAHSSWRPTTASAKPRESFRARRPRPARSARPRETGSPPSKTRVTGVSPRCGNRRTPLDRS